MSISRRGLRSAHASVKEEASNSAPPAPPALPVAPKVTSPISFTAPSANSTSTHSNNAIRIFSTRSTHSKLPGLNTSELALLRKKQAKLKRTASSTLQSLPEAAHIRNVLESTLIFTQYEAGTAICIDPAGWILTCSHCFGDTVEEYSYSSRKAWLLFYTGLAVQVECRFYDLKRDLALLEVIGIETDDGKAGNIPIFKSIPFSKNAPTNKMPIICMGQPGRDDLESTSDRKTKYNLVEVSEGTIRGMIKGVDPHDNEEIGTLMHDAWTYWGHSGAALVKDSDGSLVGLHSSWDDQTAMRHGIPWVAIKEFLEQWLPETGV